MVKENFFDDLLFYDKENLPDEIFDMLTKMVEFDTFDPIFISRSSKAASSLCSWILPVYECAKTVRSQRTKLEQVKAYQELYNKVRREFHRVNHSGDGFSLVSTNSRRKTSSG